MEKNVIWLCLLLQGDWVMAELLMMFWRVQFWTVDIFFPFPNENKLNTSSDYTLLLYFMLRFFKNFCFASDRKHSRCEMYVIAWSIASIDISAEDSPTSLQCLTALLSELWTLIFLHNYEKWIFWCSFSACPPGKAHTETQSCYSIGRQFKAVVVLDSLQGLVFECGTLVEKGPSVHHHRNDIDGVYVTLRACRLFLTFTLAFTFVDTSVLWNKIVLCPDHPDGSFFQTIWKISKGSVPTIECT